MKYSLTTLRRALGASIDELTSDRASANRFRLCEPSLIFRRVVASDRPNPPRVLDRTREIEFCKTTVLCRTDACTVRSSIFSSYLLSLPKKTPRYHAFVVKRTSTKLERSSHCLYLFGNFLISIVYVEPKETHGSVRDVFLKRSRLYDKRETSSVRRTRSRSVKLTTSSILRLRLSVTMVKPWSSNSRRTTFLADTLQSLKRRRYIEIYRNYV